MNPQKLNKCSHTFIESFSLFVFCFYFLDTFLMNTQNSTRKNRLGHNINKNVKEHAQNMICNEVNKRNWHSFAFMLTPQYQSHPIYCRQFKSIYRMSVTSTESKESVSLSVSCVNSKCLARTFETNHQHNAQNNGRQIIKWSAERSRHHRHNQ